MQLHSLKNISRENLLITQFIVFVSLNFGGRVHSKQPCNCFFFLAKLVIFMHLFLFLKEFVGNLDILRSN